LTDFILKERDKIRIEGDTSIDDFYDYGGEITIKPNVTFAINGDYIFCPTGSIIPEHAIVNSFLNRFSLETAKNGVFNNFKLYDEKPQNEAIFFPAILVTLNEEQPESGVPLFSNEELRSVVMVLDVAFKFNEIRTCSGEILEKERLADYFLYETNKIIRDIKYISDNINIGEIYFTGSVQKPEEKNQTLYGFKMDIAITYKQEYSEG